MQSELKDLDLSTLYDLLSTYTTKYTLLLRDRMITPEFKECKDAIIKLQAEIDTRIIKV